MARYEYKVVTAPTRGVKSKGLKTAEDRFSHTLEIVMNDMAAQGWDYQRAETLPSTERSGLTSSVTQWRNMLIFRRARDETVVQPAADSNTRAASAQGSPRSEPTMTRPATTNNSITQKGMSRDLTTEDERTSPDVVIPSPQHDRT